MSLDPSDRVMNETDGNTMSAVLTALRNELIVDKLFQFLPLKSLLCCSEVCKNWNKQARTYIRDHRKCTASISTSFPCSRLTELGEMVVKMTAVPYNSLQFYVKPHRPCLNRRSFKYENLVTTMKLKHLTICLEGEVRKCPAVFAIFWFLHQQRNEIRGLRFQRVSSVFVKLFAEINELEMLQLELLHIPPLHDDWSKNLIAKVLHGSQPKLKEIINNGYDRIFEILPESKYGLLSNFDLMDSPEQNVNQGMLLAQSRPTLSKLRVFMYKFLYDHHIPFNCLQIAQSLLQSSCKSIVELSVMPACVLKEISFAPLENLTFLSLSSCNESGHIMTTLQLIEFGRLFPKLQRVEVSASDQQAQDLEVPARHPEFNNEGEWDHDWDPQSFSTTTTTALTLTGHIRSFSFRQLHKSFPAVVDLSTKPGMSDAHTVPYALIFRLWPNLRTLAITGTTVDQLRNCDAEFCGINQEEVELLKSVDEEHLRDVYIVPVRPCVTTMSSKLDVLDRAH